MRRVWITLCLCSIVVLSSIIVTFAQSHTRLIESVSSPLQSVSECTISEESPISYEIKDETERRGSEIIHFYSLWVKNHSGQDFYMYTGKFTYLELYKEGHLQEPFPLTKRNASSQLLMKILKLKKCITKIVLASKVTV